MEPIEESQLSFQAQLINDLRFPHHRVPARNSDGLILLTKKSLHVYVGLVAQVNSFEEDIKSGTTLADLEKNYKRHFFQSIYFENVREIRDASSYTQQGIINIYSRRQKRPVISFAYGDECFRGFIILWLGKNGVKVPMFIDKQNSLQRFFPIILGVIAVGVLIYLATL